MVGVVEEVKAKKSTGRPSSYTPEMAQRVCELIAEGKSLLQVTKTPGLPSRQAIDNWSNTVPGFKEDLACARQACADWHADAGLEELYASRSQGKDYIAAAREIAKYHLSLAKVIDPRRYGEKVEVEHSGSVAGGLGPVIIQITAHQPAQPAQVIDCQAEKPALTD